MLYYFNKITSFTSFTSLSKYLSFIATGMLAFTFMGLPSQVVAKNTWGAKPLTEKNRPVRAWIENFATTPDVIANGSLSEAIESCDSIVGEGKYCVIEVTNNTTGLPLEIYRSKTKLIGIADMKPLTSVEDTTFISIGDNSKEVIIEGLNLQGHNATDNEIYGIIIQGQNIRKILIKNNKIHDFSSNSNAHGIAVYGSGKNNQQSIRNIIIEGNEVYSMRTGSSESIVVNGNVRRWEIKNNDIYDINNIAIDAIGGEGTSASHKNRRGRILPSSVDAARYGFIEDNFVENMSTLGNPVYDNEESWAAAIYIDGGHHIKIANNVVENSSWAYEIGAENCVTTRHITMTGNSATGSSLGDLLVGGYAKTGYRADKGINCNPENTEDENEGHGYVKYLTISQNDFKSENTSEERLSLMFRTTHAMIAESGVTAVNSNGNGSAKGDANAIKTDKYWQ
jgi:hypothetical protein